MKKEMYLRVCSRFSGALLAGLAAVFSAHADYQATVLSQGPSAYWRLNESTPTVPSVTTATNRGTLGTANNAAYIGGQGFFRGVPGALPGDTAAAFDGGSQAVQVTNPAALGPFSFSVEGWLAPDLVGANVPGGLTCALACGDFASPRAGWLIYESTSGWTFRLYNQNALSTSLNINGPTNMVAGTYYHVVATFDGTVGRVYINSVLKASGTAAGPTGFTNFVPVTAGPFSIGTRSDNAFYWQGKEDEVAYYNYALSQTQISNHFAMASLNPAGYASTIIGDAPLLYYRLDETGDPFMSNLGSLGSAGVGDLVYPAAAGVAGPVPSAFSGFDATNTAVDFTSGGYMQARPLNLNTNTVTITCWVKPSGSQPNDAGIVFHRARTASGGAYSSTAGLKIDAAGGLALAYNWDGDATAYNWASGISLNDAQWNFVALMVQPDHAVLFVPNGPNPVPATNFMAHGVLKFEGTTYLGLDPYNNLGSSTRKFAGAIDEVAIFNRALSVGEAYTEYAAAVGGVAPAIFADVAAPAGTVYVGDPLTLTVDAGGTPPLSYTWRKGGSPISGGTASSYTIPSLASGDSGNYDVVITGGSGTTNSAVANITVSAQTTPSFAQNLVIPSRTIYSNGVIKLTVQATGGGIGYQWKKNGTAIAGATTSALTISGVNGTNAGTYTVVASNSVTTATSASTTIAVATPAAGSYEAFVSADGPVSWYRLDDPVSSPYMLDAMGRWDGIWTNQGSPVTLGVSGALATDGNTAAHFDLANKSYGEVPTLPPPISTGDITFECWARTTNATDNLSPVSAFRKQYGYFFEKNGSGSWQGADGYGDLDGSTDHRVSPGNPNPSGQWVHLVGIFGGSVGHKFYINGAWDGNGPFVDFSRDLNTPLLVGAVGPLPGGNQYFFSGEIDEVAVYNKALSDTQILSHYQAGKFGNSVAPFWLQQPASPSVLVGTTVSLTANADGSFPISYQWFKNGSPVAGATTTTLTVSSVQYVNNGDAYSLRATNSAGTNFSATATLKVYPANPTFLNNTNGLVLHLKFDGDYLDSSGRGNNGTATGSNSVPTIIAGKIGSGALRYETKTDLGPAYSSGTPVVTNNSYVALGMPTDLRFSSNVSFSVAYWVRLPVGQTNGDLPFLSSATNSYGNPGFTFAPSYRLGGWSFSFNGTVQLYGPNNSLNDGNWHLMVHSIDRTGFVVTYRDGVQVDSRLGTGIGDLEEAGVSPINIGSDATGLYPEESTADLDDLGVWRRALTAYEAYAMYYIGNTYGKSFDFYGGTTPLILQQSGASLVLVWQGGTLQQADAVTGPWTPVPGAAAPYFKVTPATTGNKFYRVHD